MFVKAEFQVDDCKQWDEEREMISCLRSNAALVLQVINPRVHDSQNLIGRNARDEFLMQGTLGGSSYLGRYLLDCCCF
jgi:hypothetical protein